MKRSRAFKAGAFLLLALLAAACGPSATPEAAATAAPAEPTAAPVEQVFTVAVGRDVGNLNPYEYDSNFIALDLIYEPLIRRAADGSFVPALAESWDISEDGLTWTFHLRQGVTFHDGTPFDAEAAKWNLEMWIGTEDHSWLPTANIVNAIETPDDHTVVLKMDEFYYAALDDLALFQPTVFIGPNAMDADGNFAGPIGTGAWRVEENTPEQRTVLVPYEEYWGEHPGLERLVLEVIPDDQTRIAALQSGELDLVGGEYLAGLALESVPILQTDDGVRLVTAPGSTTYLLQMNYHRAPFDDVAVRRALNQAIDREAISSQVFHDLASPAQGIFAANMPYVNHPHPEYYAYDPEAARAALAEAGWTPGADGILEKDGERMEVELIADGDLFPQARSMAEVLQAEMREIGIQMEPRMLDFGGWSDALMSGGFDLSINITYGTPFDPHSTLTALFYTGFTGTEGTIYADPALDAMIDEVLGERDEAQRQAGYDAIWAFLDDNAAAAPIVHPMRVYAVDSSIEGFQLAGTEYALELSGLRITAAQP
jgi:nickel transport system substrate-binding protein